MEQKRGRKAADGATDVTERINLSVTEAHKRMLAEIAPDGASSWIRRTIEAEYHKKIKGTKK